MNTAMAHQQELEHQQMIELEEKEEREALEQMALDLDEIAKILDTDEWWREQDRDMEKEELEMIEALAEIQEYRTKGYM